jgi:site-specific recombinase XerD
MKPTAPNQLAVCLRDYFMDHLPRLRGLSPNTVLSYRDSLVLLLRFLARERKREACDLDLDDIDPDQVLAFLNHLEQDRHNGVPTRNVRLAAIHAFFRYVGARHPDQLERAQRILAVPFKRGQQRAVEYLEQDEIEAILSRIERASQAGRRDYVLLATMFNTGARVQEMINLRVCDLQLTHPYQLQLLGKGRKERFCPLWSQTAQVLREFCEERGLDLRSETRVFLNQRGGQHVELLLHQVDGAYFVHARDAGCRRGHGAIPRHCGPLRRDRLFGVTAKAGDRHSHGAGGGKKRCSQDGHQPGNQAGIGRCGDWPCRGAGPDALLIRLALRRQAR